MEYKAFRDLKLSRLGFGNMRLPEEGGRIDRVKAKAQRNADDHRDPETYRRGQTFDLIPGRIEHRVNGDDGRADDTAGGEEKESVVIRGGKDTAVQDCGDRTDQESQHEGTQAG